jgi:hypothetical protein
MSVDQDEDRNQPYHYPDYPAFAFISKGAANARSMVPVPRSLEPSHYAVKGACLEVELSSVERGGRLCIE